MMSYGCGNYQTTPIDTVMLTQFLGNLINEPKQPAVGVVIAKPHPYVFHNAFLGTWRPHSKFLPDWSVIKVFWQK